MKIFRVSGVATLICLSLFSFCSERASAAESTMRTPDQINPEIAAKYSYTEDGAFSEALKLPTYEWMPADGPQKAIVLGIHGLTMHGRRFRVLARSLAVNGMGFISLDMRGFGRCHFDDKMLFSTKDDDKTKVNHEKSYQEIVKLAELIKTKYPNLRLIALGESLGCTFCVRLAGEHPELVNGIVLSAPAVRINRSMYRGKGQIKEGIKAVVKRKHELDMSGYFSELASQRPEVQKEMIDDPMVLQELPLKALLSTSKFVKKTISYGKTTDKHLPVLIIQGNRDGCVSPKHVTELMNSMPSDDQNLAWRGNFGHLQLETAHMRTPIIDALGGWLLNHGQADQTRLKELQQTTADLGGIVTN